MEVDNSLIFNTHFGEQIKLIHHIKQQQQLESEQTHQIKWQLLKHEISESAINYSKKISQNAVCGLMWIRKKTKRA